VVAPDVAIDEDEDVFRAGTTQENGMRRGEVLGKCRHTASPTIGIFV
jgi:hypothetical protein